MDVGTKRKAMGSHRNRKKFKNDETGDYLEKDTYEYFRGIADVLNTNTDEEEIKIIAENSMRQTEGIELCVSKHIVSATVLERVIPYASWSHIQRIADALMNQADDSKDSCECRLEEAIVKEAGKRVKSNEDQEEQCLRYIVSKCDRILESFHTAITDLKLNYAARTCLTVCSTSGENSEFSRIVKCFYRKTMDWNELSDHYYEGTVSGYLQILLSSLHAVSRKSCEKFAKFMFRTMFMKDCDSESLSASYLLEMFQNVSWSRLLESLIDVASTKLLLEINKKYFSNHLETLAMSDKGHFSVCKLITSTNGDKDLLANILETLGPKFSELMVAHRLNILHAISEACLKSGQHQAEFIKHLMASLACSGPNKEKYMVICVISMQPKDDVNQETLTINYHGSLILQNIFRFKKPAKFVEAFLSLNTSTMKRILMDPKGCFVTDAFIESDTVGGKSKDRLLNALKGHYSDLAMDKFGSRSFDVIWKYANIKTRALVLSEMTRKIQKTRYGSIISAKTGLDQFIKDRTAWERSTGGSHSVANKARLFEKILK